MKKNLELIFDVKWKRNIENRSIILFQFMEEYFFFIYQYAIISANLLKVRQRLYLLLWQNMMFDSKNCRCWMKWTFYVFFPSIWKCSCYVSCFLFTLPKPLILFACYARSSVVDILLIQLVKYSIRKIHCISKHGSPRLRCRNRSVGPLSHVCQGQQSLVTYKYFSIWSGKGVNPATVCKTLSHSPIQCTFFWVFAGLSHNIIGIQSSTHQWGIPHW